MWRYRMKRKLFFVSVIFLMCSFKSNAEENPPLNFASEFCEEYGIESYEELEEIYDMYITAVDYGAESSVDIVDAFISHSIIEYDLGKDAVDDLLYYETTYGYGAVDNILRAVDEIGYSELTGDYSYIHKNYDNDESETTTENVDYKWYKNFMYEFSDFCNRNWYFLLGIISWGIIILYIAFKSWNEKRK